MQCIDHAEEPGWVWTREIVAVESRFLLNWLFYLTTSHELAFCRGRVIGLGETSWNWLVSYRYSRG